MGAASSCQTEQLGVPTSLLRAGRQAQLRSRLSSAPYGFTLIEVLVALVILSIIATLTWSGISGLLRTKEVAQEHLAMTLRIQSTLAQLEADIGALYDTLSVPPLTFDGANLRLTRASPNGVQLVVWSLRRGRWQRWASPPLKQVAELNDMWLRSLQLIGKEANQITALQGLTQWQIYMFYGNAWANAQSSGDLAKRTLINGQANQSLNGSTPNPSTSNSSPDTSGMIATNTATSVERIVLPAAIRVVLSFDPESKEAHGLNGTLTRDIRVPPQYLQ